MAPEAHHIEMELAEKKAMASDWFAALRDDICAAFEAIEDSVASKHKPAGRFERKSWNRDGGGGGEMSLMHGQVFEKVGVNISTVFGFFSDDFRVTPPYKSYKQKVSAVDRFSDRYKICLLYTSPSPRD